MRARLPFIVIGLVAGLFFDAAIAMAWTGPTQTAPNGNISAPVNVSATTQVKSGDLSVNRLFAFGNIILPDTGTGRFINFDYNSSGLTDINGYGFRDHAGIMEFKNSASPSWTPIPSSGGSSQWGGTSGNPIFYNLANVGIGTATPGKTLDVTGDARTSGELQSTRSTGNAYAQFRAISGNYGFMLRNDGADTWALFTASADQYGTWNTLRPLRINDASGDVYLANGADIFQHSTGNVGIGTVTPGVPLQVIGTAAVGKVMGTGNNTYSTADAVAGDIVIGSSANGGIRHDASIMFWDLAGAARILQHNSASGNAFYFSTWTSDALTGANVVLGAPSGTPSYFLGNVGVGTAAPINKLTVAGDTNGRAQIGTSGCGGDYVAITLWRTVANTDCTQYNILSSPTDNNLYINHPNSGSLLFRGNNVDQMAINPSGAVGIGTTAPTQKLQVIGTVIAQAFLYSSDARLKMNVAPLTTGLQTLMKLKPVSFTWKTGAQKGEEDTGFIAQEIEKILPEVVHTGTDGMKSVDYVKLTPLLVKAVQEQQAEIDALKADVAALKAAK